MSSVSKPQKKWTFLTNHSHILLCLAVNPKSRVRDLATKVAITERAVLRILSDLNNGGYIEKERDGRMNIYTLKPEMNLRHPIECHCKLEDLVSLVQKFEPEV